MPRRIAQYEIVRLIGRGGMGVLYQARDTTRHREVALKVMSPDIVEDEEARARFRQEAQLAARQHRNIVKVYEFGEDGELPFIAMEFLRGRSLADRLASGEPLTLESKLDIVIQVCDGLQCLHEEGIVHRDVKPANIWLLEDRGVKLLDLGIAKHGSLKLTQYGNVVGSVAYIAPEQLGGSRVDGRADIFSAGVVLYELLSGQRPFQADSITAVMMKVLHEAPPDIREFVPDLPDDISRALDAALKKDPAERYAEAAEFASDLRLARAMSQAALAPQPLTARAAPAPEDLTLASTVLSTRKTAGGTPVPVVEHDPVLRSQPKVPVPPAVRLPATPEPRSRAPFWIAGAVAATAVLALGIWFALGPGAPAFELEVRSTPEGASISIDGAPTGRRTPATVPLATRPSRIGLTLAGYQPIDTPLAKTADSRVELAYRLDRLLQVQSEPPGARIMLDGRDTGFVTPAAVPLGDPYPSGVELRMDGHEPGHAPITSAIVEAGTVSLTLPAVRVAPKPSTPAPTSGRQVAVTVSGSYPFEVSGCGTSSRASQSHSLKVSPPCKLRLRAQEYYLDETREVIATAGGQMALVAPQLASVQIRSRHTDCTLHVDGKAVGTPPMDVNLASGTHEVMLLCPDGDTLRSQPFEIEPGKSIRRIDDLLR
jgi:predicted Ser/Thr protein kinase